MNDASPPRSPPAGFAPDDLRLLLESVTDYAIFMLDAEGRVATWNPGATKIKGYAASEIIGRHFSAFYPPEDVAAGKPERELQIAATQGRVEDEGWRVRKDGSRFWANVVITALRDDSGELRGFAKVTRDLTRSSGGRWSGSASRRSASACSSDAVTDYAIFMLDPDGHVATWNAGAERSRATSPRGDRRAALLGLLPRRRSRRRQARARARDRTRRRAAARTKAGACARTAAASGRTS